MNDSAGLSRKQLLQYGATGAVGLGALGLVGCGDDDSDSEASGAKAKPGGRLRVGMLGGGTTDTLDAQLIPNGPSVARVQSLHDALLGLDHDSKIIPALAEEVTHNADATVWTARLRKGVTFHDGKPLTADDVIFTIKRALDPKFPNAASTTWQVVDLKKLRKIDDLTVEIALTQPLSVFDGFLTGGSFIVPVGYDPKKPVGTGPFIYESFTPGGTSVFKKNPDYWGEKALVDQLVITDFADPQAAANAMAAGQLDALESVSPTGKKLVENSGARTVTTKGGSMAWLTMRVDVAPFNDVNVRQALRLVVDRQGVVNSALQGAGRVANDLWSPNDSNYNKSIPQREQDIEQAKSLLKKAGHENLNIELVSAPIGTGTVETAQVFAEQAKAAGVTVKQRQVDPGAFYGEQYGKYNFAVDLWPSVTFVVNSQFCFLPDAAFNTTHWDDPEWTKKFNDGLREVDTAKRKELWDSCQQIFWERGSTIIPTFSNGIEAYGKNVVPPKPDASGIQFSNFRFAEIGFSA